MVDPLNVPSGEMGRGRTMWPSGRGGGPVSGSGSTPTSGGIREGVSVQTPDRTGQTAPTTPTTPEAGAAATGTAAKEVRQQYGPEHFQALLRALQIPDSNYNTQLAMLMSRMGIELSKEMFSKLFQMLQGTDGGVNMQEAAILLLSKGVTDGKAVDILGKYFADNPQLAQQVVALQEAMANLQGALLVNRQLLNSTVVTQLGALLSQIDENLKDNFLNKNGVPKLGREQLITNLRALKALLEGVQEDGNRSNQEITGESELLSSSMMNTIGKLNGTLENLIAQAILGQQSRAGDLGKVDYLYYQIPNELVEPPKDMEIIIKRDPSDAKGKIDPNDTQIMMSLDTNNLGKISVLMKIRDKKVSFLFNTENENTRKLIGARAADLGKKLAEQNYQTKTFQTRVNKTISNIKAYLIPRIGWDKLMRIVTSA